VSEGNRVGQRIEWVSSNKELCDVGRTYDRKYDRKYDRTYDKTNDRTSERT